MSVEGFKPVPVFIDPHRITEREAGHDGQRELRPSLRIRSANRVATRRPELGYPFDEPHPYSPPKVRRRKGSYSRSRFTSSRSRVAFQSTGASEGRRSSGQSESRQKISRKYDHGSTSQSLQLASGDVKVALTAPASS